MFYDSECTYVSVIRCLVTRDGILFYRGIVCLVSFESIKCSSCLVLFTQALGKKKAVCYLQFTNKETSFLIDRFVVFSA